MLNHNILILIACIFYVVFLIVQISKRKTATQIYISSAMYLYLVSIFCLVFFPIPFQHNLLVSLKNEIHQPQNNFIPIHDIYQIVTRDRWEDIAKQIGGNIFMFTPLGFLLPIAKPNTPLSKVLLFGATLSVCIEALQLTLDTIINYNYRISDIDDVICNLIGVIIGYLIFKIIDKLLGITTLNMHSNKIALKER
ncbi:MAG: VanZ family protein [Tumebacillaceae bacterium]